MDLIFINKNKLKIMLNNADMADYSLSPDTIDYNDVDAKNIFYNILNRAKKETGFDFENGRIFIQLYPSKEGGCEMYVTKLCGVSKRDDEKDSGEMIKGKRRCAYSFESLDSMLSVCRRLFSLDYSEKSSAFSYSDRFYLLLSEPEETAYIPLSEFSFIKEFGRSESYKNTELLLIEKGSCICNNNAVETLAAF